MEVQLSSPTKFWSTICNTFCSPGKVKNLFLGKEIITKLFTMIRVCDLSQVHSYQRECLCVCVCVCVCACRGGGNWGQWANYWAPAQGLAAASLAYIEWQMKINNMNWLAGGSILRFQVDPSSGLLLLC